MKDIAFLILAHTDPVQVARLCRALDYRARIYVHLDAKVDIRPFLAQPLPESVVFIQDRVRVSWAAYSQVDAALRMMRATLDSGHDFSHLVLLSGLDYPIKPLSSLHAFLNLNAGRELIGFVDASVSPAYRVFYEHYWFLEAGSWLRPASLDRLIRHGFGRALRQFVRKPQPTGMTCCWGSAYWALTPACAQHILEYGESNPAYVKWAKSSFAVDEHYFHTVVAHSRFLESSEGFKAYEGAGPQTWRLGCLHINRRKLHTEADFDELRDSDKYFVRKIVSGQSDRLVERLNAEILYANTSSASFAESDSA